MDRDPLPVLKLSGYVLGGEGKADLAIERGAAILILFIDDERNIGGDDVQTARTSAEALQLLKSNSYDEIWFDHDLGGDDTTIPVVEYLAELAFNGAPYSAKIVIHTANPVGRATIKRTLERWKYPCVVKPATTWSSLDIVEDN